MKHRSEYKLPDRWVVHGTDRTGAPYAFPTAKDAQHSLQDAEDLLKRLVKTGAKLTITKEVWNSVRGKYVRVV